MKKGINEEMGVPAALRTDRMAEFNLIRNAGFDGVELFFEREFTAQELADIKDAMAQTGIEVFSLVTPLFWFHPLTSSDPGERALGMDALRAMVRTAKELGAPSILCVPGLVDETVSYLDAYNNSLGCFLELKPFIEEQGVNVCIENVWNKFLLSPLEMRDFIDRIDSVFVGAYLDAGNVLVNSYPDYWAQILGSRIKKVHIKDFKNSIGNIQGFVNLFEGDMDWRRLMASLRAAGYDDYVTVEVGAYEACPEKFLYDTADALGKIFAM